MVPKVKDRMTSYLVYIQASATIHAAAQRMAQEKIGSLFVLDKEETIGIVTETDLVRKALAIGLDPFTTAVEKIMSAPVLSIDAESSLIEANTQMEENNIRHLGVTDQGKLNGVLSVRDLLHPIRVDSGETVSVF
jgi:signal-transduction protein with cAMP-binding, CBS, and nucleotidyltransferase domain